MINTSTMNLVLRHAGQRVQNNHDNVIAKSSVRPMLRMKGVALNASSPNAMSVVQADSVTLRIAVTR